MNLRGSGWRAAAGRVGRWAVAAAAIAGSGLAWNGRAEVGLTLRVPEAETWVIGDAIPLYWQFSNQSTQALGFMWEGCCRLNGKLAVRAADAALPTAPPGQALAHMFAKADRLDPGIPKEYDTKVSDWVALPGTGTYQLQGTYRGVLPTQFPQVQRGLALWRDAAESPPIRLAVLGVDDYLRQEGERARSNGLRLTLSGPSRLPPLEPAVFRVGFENLEPAPRTVKWPDEVALWVLNGRHERVAPMAVIPGATLQLTVPGRGRREVEFALEADRFESEPLGDYVLFVDLAGTGRDRPRVPSGPIPLAWRLDAAEVNGLVEAASRGAGTGARNAPLKMLRVYLEEVGPILAALDRAALSEEARGLADRLAFAARLKPVGPRPGLVSLQVEVAADGALRWAQPSVRAAWAGGGGGVDEQLGEMLGLRRHLGWEVRVVLDPADEAPLSRVFAAGALVDGHAAELAGPAELWVATGGTNAPARLALGRTGEAGVQAEVVRSGAGWGLRTADPAGVDGAGSAAGRVPEGVRRVGLPGEVRWREAREAMEALLVPGARLEVVPAAKFRVGKPAGP